jgi:hypothetical protein
VTDSVLKDNKRICQLQDVFIVFQKDRPEVNLPEEVFTRLSDKSEYRN